jgi:hypothetical protein
MRHGESIGGGSQEEKMGEIYTCCAQFTVTAHSLSLR